MNRRHFLYAASALAASTPLASHASTTPTSADAATKPPSPPAKLNLCLQWGTIPGNDINAKLDFLEANHFQSLELPSGDALIKLTPDLSRALTNRNLTVTTACGPSDFSAADPAARQRQVDALKPIIEKIAELKGTGVIICPARSKPELPFPDLRKDFIENTAKQLADHAHQFHTSIILEPLRRQETPFLRQVADATMIAKEIGNGARVMADFWHMSFEEPSQYAAILAADSLLAHVHIASLKRRLVPGLDGPADLYIQGFKALKQIRYQGAVSFEGGFPKDTPPETKIALLQSMSTLLHQQWNTPD